MTAHPHGSHATGTAWDESMVRHRYADLGDVRLHYVEAGPDDGPLVVLLHGFPEFWYSWRRQIPALAAAGRHVVAPDQRGYNLSDRPAGIDSYHITRLARDVARLIEAVGAERADVVGHDWGGIVAWFLAMRHPEHVRRLVILNVLHPARLVAERVSARQLRRSWYVLFFRIPVLPELALKARGYGAIRRAFRRDVMDRSAVTAADLDRYVEAIARPGALTATINWYRAAVRAGRTGIRALLRPVTVPVLVIWGDRDRYAGPEMAAPPAALAPKTRIVHFPDASHWAQFDRADDVNHLLAEFLGADG